MKIDIQHIIENALSRFTEESELRRNTTRDILYKNIDILICGVEEWFDNKPPKEYSEVLRSLMVLSTSFLVGRIDYKDIFNNEDYEEIDLKNIINEVAVEFDLLFNYKKIQIEFKTGEQYRVLASTKVLIESLCNILLSVYMFMDEQALAAITLENEKTSVITRLTFKSLKETYPGLSKIQKTLFSHIEGEDYRVGIGIKRALSRLREMGGQAKVQELHGKNGFMVQVSFPSVQFLKTVNEIRLSENTIEKKGKRELLQGNILLIVDDFVIEMVLWEFLHDNGYNILKFDLIDLENIVDYSIYKALIVDSGYIINNFVNIDLFKSYTERFTTVLILYGEGDLESIADFQHTGFITMKKPVEVDKIIDYIENGA
ncbi:MAG: hypothetical protein GY754_28035 [bacterium]|nr:hypothetical protein [bacterium]